ncbi:unnamed protein product [Adineta steineri]|uniref:Uncharacterized protein n=1 Tax=Adineta steineri TaxID=433720 RepID=A0A815UA27_9BILA|nr:unnamed protein product [Adineta steineri]CAF4013642.1 unnamed protein product [Adineta steineri]
MFVVIAGFLALTWVAIWQYLLPVWICSSLPFATSILPFCKVSNPTLPPDPKNLLIKMQSVPTFVEKSIELAERLSNADVSAPHKLTEVKISLIDLKSRVSYSDIDAPTKKILQDNIAELKTSVQATTENIHKMLASFGGTLSKLEIYTRYALTFFKDESLEFATSLSSSSNTGLVKASFENRIQSQIQHYVENIENKVDDIIRLAEDVHAQLLDVETKYETIDDILSENHEKTQTQLDEIEQNILDEPVFAKLYRKTIGDGDLGKLKHQRNLATLKEFKNYIKSGIIDVNNIILRLRNFKHEADELKSTVTDIDLGQTMSLSVYLDILQNGIEQLKQSKQRLSGRIKNGHERNIDNESEDADKKISKSTLININETPEK